MPDTLTPKDPATPKPHATILVCYHKFSTPIIASEILRPIIVGAANMGEGARSLQEKLESKLPKNLRLGGGQIALDSSSLSLRGDTIAEAIYTNAQNADSTQTHNEAFLEMDCHADKSARNDRSNAPNAKNVSNSQAEAKVDSRKNATNARKSAKDSRRDYSASAESMDCHADTSARNDSSFGHCERSEAIHNSSPKQAKHSFCGKATSPVLRDDSGENISHLNANFCELTAMYWAWKNVDSSYYGLFHYRRILDLSEQAQQIRTDYPIIASPRSYNPKRQGLTTENIAKLLQEYDIILPQGYKNHYNLACDEGLDNYGIYAHYHYAKDLDRIIELIKSRHPEMQAALESTLFTYPPRWHIANIFIMRKELYFAYCEWLFSLLFDLSKETDLSDYTPYQARIYGFLSERMFNIWLAYQRHTQTLKILEAPMLLLTKHTKPLIGWDINEKHKRFYLFGVRVYKKSVNPKS